MTDHLWPTVAADEGEPIKFGDAIACAEGHAQAATWHLNEFSLKPQELTTNALSIAQAHAQAATAYALLADMKRRNARDSRSR